MSRAVLSATAARRLLHELAALHKEARKDEHVTELAPVDEDAEDLTEWRAVIVPPEGPYAGGRFVLTIRVPENYPVHPPTIHFGTRIFHPNIHWRTGEPVVAGMDAPVGMHGYSRSARRTRARLAAQCGRGQPGAHR
ncbi:E2 ubiquitin-conjugating enzyme [Malassezia cuniculi]|uniref:E2 ubiquitin-conjugating enzyme n=1 Tax=Malassezia cuniculi TaxID=948313 RepID=A0AAF0EP71_9BASI|nr:E2 ubiquitin-conjugating enzyme [Malassezia cuniculi]